MLLSFYNCSLLLEYLIPIPLLAKAKLVAYYLLELSCKNSCDNSIACSCLIWSSFCHKAFPNDYKLSAETPSLPDMSGVLNRFKSLQKFLLIVFYYCFRFRCPVKPYWREMDGHRKLVLELQAKWYARSTGISRVVEV